MPMLEIDGEKVKASEGDTILQAAQKAGIHIPYLCYHEDMEPYGGCRLCMVEVTEGGRTRLQPSCAYPAKKGLVVKTRTEGLEKGRKLIAELLLARCPNVKVVENLAADLGVGKTRFKKDDKDCVLCGRCVRACRFVVRTGAIDFIGRGYERRVGTPFDLPSESCVGCGSCAYVCPTGAIDMEYENVLRWRKLPGPLRQCRYMRMGFISHKICSNDYACWNCEVDQRMEDEARTHPVFMLKEARQSEKEKIGAFELRFDRMYGEAHIWVKRMNGLVRLGIDDFASQVVGKVDDLKVPPVKSLLKSGDPVWLVIASDKALHMYVPLSGRILDINPDILDNPSLVSMDPYGRGWILTLEPEDILEASKKLLSGRSAKEWLKLDSRKLRQMLQKNMDLRLDPDQKLQKEFSDSLDKSVWHKIERTFFVHKEKKVRLRGIGDVRLSS